VDHALGRSRGGWGTKAHLVCDRRGRPIAALLSAGQAHEARLFEQAMSLALARGRPQAIAGDKGYSSGRIRAWIEAAGALDVVPTKSHEPRKEGFDKGLYRERNVVERCFGWLKECRRVATRYEKLAAHFLAMVKIAMIRRLLDS